MAEQSSAAAAREADLDPLPDDEPRYPGSGRLAGRVALVTGGDSGIGRAVCVLFAREGADVALAYHDADEDAAETRRRVEAEGRQCPTQAFDVGDPTACERFVAAALARFKKLDVLVNNAAQQHYESDPSDYPPEEVERVFRTNIFGYFNMVRAALPHLKEGAAVVNTTSVTAYKGSPGLLDHSSTKGAIVTYTRSLALALAERGVRVNGVAPGLVWTPLIPSTMPPDKVKTFGQDVPLKRPGQPADVAPSFLFLACQDSSWMTGQVLHPNGGSVVNG